MNLPDYLRVVRKRWKSIVAAMLIGLVAGAAFVLTSTKMYRATAGIFVSTSGAEAATASDLALGNTFTQARVQSYISQANTPAVTDAVVRQLNLRISSNKLAGEISADAPLNKVLINLHVTDRDPAQAALLANTVATQFSKVIQDLEQTSATIPSAIKLTVTRPAHIPTVATTPRVKRDIAIGLFIGLLAGLAQAFLRQMLDNTVKDPAELAARSKLSVLGTVPWDKQAPDVPIAFRADTHGSRAEAFRRMRINLEFVDVDNPPHVIAVTSALPKEGKSHTSLNLAAALAEAGHQVCLIEADLRKPSVARTLGLVGDVGLTSVLIGRAEVDDVLQNAGLNLTVLTCGPVPPNPSELLNSEAFRTALAYIRESVDVVIIDTAPLLPVADGAQVASLADATLLVVRAAKTTHEQINRAIENLAHVGVTPVGVVLSMAPNRRGDGYYYYSEYRPERGGHGRASRAGPPVEAHPRKPASVNH